LKSNFVKEIYEKTAEDYDRWVIPCKKCQYMMLIESLDLKGDEIGLDVGCGPGELTRTLAQRLDTGKVIGLDISANMVELAAEKTEKRGINNVEFVNANYKERDYKDKFDVCVSSYLFHWLEDPRVFLRWVRRALQDQGKLGVISPSPEWYREVQKAYHHVLDKYDVDKREIIGKKVYQQKDIEKFFENEGFLIRSFNEFSFKEDTSIETCLRRINAKSGQSYFRDIPENLKEEARESFMEELKNHTKKLVTTESGYIVIATRM